MGVPGTLASHRNSWQVQKSGLYSKNLRREELTLIPSSFCRNSEFGQGFPIEKRFRGWSPASYALPLPLGALDWDVVGTRQAVLSRYSDTSGSSLSSVPIASLVNYNSTTSLLELLMSVW